MSQAAPKQCCPFAEVPGRSAARARLTQDLRDSQFTTAVKSRVFSPTPPRQISKPAKTLVRYQLLLIGCPYLVVASLMNWFRSKESEPIDCVRTYEMQGLPLFVPTQTSHEPLAPEIETPDETTP